ncbi:unnamed protein product [Rotaria sp. Silwood1]|nr:unnamed protein product [Rotaria sp. Silwood1]CAF1298816.1 unnamed protein product [Rotaria sp. Silwood1]CAF3535129.1 unnamed protein product [Rotaria sp. Silwood1]CAF4581980.1 unnamed protein product [Rotaria sp. Silwood1]
MSQDPNMYYPPQQGTYSSYSPQQPGFYGQYPPQSNSYTQQSSTLDDKNMPPYVDPNTAISSERNQVSFQTPPIIPHNLPPAVTAQSSGGWGKFSGIETKRIRHGFIRKVYAILMVQLLFTFGIIAIFHFTPAIRNYIRSPRGQWAYWTSYGVFFATYIALACCKRLGRRYPLNLILLSILTLSMSYMMSMISAYFKIESVFIAVGLTSFVCFGVTIFSFQTKFDFTSCVGVLFVISLALVGFGFACIFTYSRILYTVYAALGAVAFSIFLAVDTQLILGGKRHEISPEDHVFASIMLYLDIVYIFMYILMLFGKRE